MNSGLRSAIILTLISFSLGTVRASEDQEGNAVTDVSEGRAVINAFIKDPAIAERLRADELSVGRITRRALRPGVTEYVLHVHTCAMCNPGKAKSGLVTITEDVRPTYMDAAIEYSVSFRIDKAGGR